MPRSAAFIFSIGEKFRLEVWIESTALPEARIDPVVIQAERLEVGDTILAAWPIELGGPVADEYLASIVATSPRHSPRRLLTTLKTSFSGDDRR